MEPTYIVAGTQPDDRKIWQVVPTLLEAFGLGAAWRAAQMRDITVGVVVQYTATIQITTGDGQTFELPVPDTAGA